MTMNGDNASTVSASDSLASDSHSESEVRPEQEILLKHGKSYINATANNLVSDTLKSQQRLSSHELKGIVSTPQRQLGALRSVKALLAEERNALHEPEIAHLTQQMNALKQEAHDLKSALCDYQLSKLDLEDTSIKQQKHDALLRTYSRAQLRCTERIRKARVAFHLSRKERSKRFNALASKIYEEFNSRARDLRLKWIETSLETRSRIKEEFKSQSLTAVLDKNLSLLPTRPPPKPYFEYDLGTINVPTFQATGKQAEHDFSAILANLEQEHRDLQKLERERVRQEAIEQARREPIYIEDEPAVSNDVTANNAGVRYDREGDPILNHLYLHRPTPAQTSAYLKSLHHQSVEPSTPKTAALPSMPRRYSPEIFRGTSSAIPPSPEFRRFTEQQLGTYSGE